MFRFLFGLGLGYAIGMVIAPASGEETRRELMERGEQKVAEVVHKGRQRAGEIAREAAEQGFDEAARRTIGSEIVDRSQSA
jgi:gas vesicle protein